MKAFNLDRSVAALARDGSSYVVEPAPGPPLRIDGFTVGAPKMTTNPPHRGEMHPDGDELLYLVSGRVEVIIEEGGTETTVGVENVATLTAGQAILGAAKVHGTGSTCASRAILCTSRPAPATATAGL